MRSRTVSRPGVVLALDPLGAAHAPRQLLAAAQLLDLGLPAHRVQYKAWRWANPTSRSSMRRTSTCSTRALTCGSGRSSARTPRGSPACDGTHFAVWAPNADAGQRGRRLERLEPERASAAQRCGRSGIWEGFVPGVGARRALQVPRSSRAAAAAGSTRPTRSRSTPRCRRAPHRWSGRSTTSGATRSGWRPRARPQRARTRRSRSTRCTSARGGARRSGRSLLATASSRTCSPDYVAELGLHARRAAAGHGAPVLRLVGLPDDRLLRADQPLRHAAGPDVPDRPPAPARASA